MIAGVETFAGEILAAAGFTADCLPGALRLAEGLGFQVFYLADQAREHWITIREWHGFVLAPHRHGTLIFVDQHRSPTEKAWIIALAVARTWTLALEQQLRQETDVDERSVALALLMPQSVMRDAFVERGGDVETLAEDFGVDVAAVRARLDMLDGVNDAAA